jgi:drug/metabolite transporter (DMT)-like permease
MNNQTNKTLKADVTLLGVAFIWGCGFVVTRQAIDLVSPMQLTFYRFILAAIISLVVFHKRLKQIDKTYLKSGTVLGILLAGGFIFQTYGIVYTTVSNNAFLTSSNVVLVPFLVWLIYRKRPIWSNFLAAFVLLIGMSLMMLDFHNLTCFNLGDLLTLGCAVFFALYAVFVGKYVQHQQALLLHIVELGVAAIILFFAALLLDGSIQPIPPQAYLGLAYLSILSTLVCFLLQLTSQKRTAPTRAAILISFESVFGTLGSALLLHEIMPPQVYIGCGIIFIAVLIAELGAIQS